MIEVIMEENRKGRARLSYMEHIMVGVYCRKYKDLKRKAEKKSELRIDGNQFES